MRRASILVIVLICTLLMVAGCAPGPNTALSLSGQSGEAGFLMGLWHGLIIGVSFVWSLFDSQVNIYEVQNSGWPYNLGYVIGLGILGTSLFESGSSSNTAVTQEK